MGGQQCDPGDLRGYVTELVSDLGIDTAAQVRAVLFRGTHRQQCAVHALRGQGADFLPGQLPPFA